jgi:predicted metal-dependent phosphoesterase TrpH
MKADLHVHSWFSTENRDLAFLRSRDCYSPPDQIYRTARARGMDLVTLTDHDTFDGCLDFLATHPHAADFLPGEEVSCRFPDGDIEVHLGVYGMTEALHRELQPLRGNVFEVTACLREAGVVFALNHPLAVTAARARRRQRCTHAEARGSHVDGSAGGRHGRRVSGGSARGQLPSRGRARRDDCPGR